MAKGIIIARNRPSARWRWSKLRQRKKASALPLICLCLGLACENEEPDPREIRAHTTSFQGVAHAEPAKFASRYCSVCHGDALAGGNDFEPSCFQCHGTNWHETDAHLSRAPSDHNLDHSGIMHHPSLFEPTSTCVSCHGANLEGNAETGRPPCELCHERLWEQ